MVLPPPAPDLEEAATVAVDRLRGLLELGAAGTLLLAVGGEGWVGRLWRAFAPLGRRHAAADIDGLLASPPGSLVLYGALPEDATWLNLHRPFFAEGGRRVVVLANADTVRSLRRAAPDFFDWISHRVELPEAPDELLVARLRAGLSGVVGWSGAGWEEVLPWVTSAPVRLVGANRPRREWVEDLGFPGVLVVRDATDSPSMEWTIAMGGARGGLLVLDPPLGSSFPTVRPPKAWRVAARHLREHAGADAGRLAAESGRTLTDLWRASGSAQPPGDGGAGAPPAEWQPLEWADRARDRLARVREAWAREPDSPEAAAAVIVAADGAAVMSIVAGRAEEALRVAELAVQAARHLRALPTLTRAESAVWLDRALGIQCAILVGQAQEARALTAYEERLAALTSAEPGDPTCQARLGDLVSELRRNAERFGSPAWGGLKERALAALEAGLSHQEASGSTSTGEPGGSR